MDMGTKYIYMSSPMKLSGKTWVREYSELLPLLFLLNSSLQNIPQYQWVPEWI